MRRATLLGAGTLAMAMAAPSMAQSGGLRAMETDRPDRTNTPSTIDAGHVQLEVGAFDTVLDRDGADARTRTWSLAQVNARVGVTDDLELNVIVEPHDVLHDRDDGHAHGIGDTTVGLKWNLWGNGGGATALAIQPQVTLPTARDPLGNGHVEVDVNVPFKAEGPAGLGVSVQPTVSWLRSEDDTHYVAGWGGAAAIDHDLGPANLYAEYAVSDTAERGARAAHLLDLGATVQATGTIALDAATEIGLSRGADDIRMLTGASIRF